ncbi:hypothetical protein ScalyP_jg10426 [Parmales sp. scaly parma]|nr:hypothetical protein ScalyP_jg10426 [Parmales sp. scaly parma]
MGGHMTNNLLAKGVPVVVYDLSEDAMAKCEANGATIASSLNDPEITSASTIITMLPSSPHVQSTITTLLETNAIKPSTTFIDSSTIDPSVSKKLSALVSAHNSCKMIDAPVSGGVGGAEAGTLTFMAGCQSASDLEPVRKYFEIMGSNLVHTGGAGTGCMAKLCNNLAMAISMVGTSEAMHLGEKMGIDGKVLAGIMNTSTARCWSSDTYNPVPGVLPNVPSSKDWEGGFGVALMLKDLRLAMDAKGECGASGILGTEATALYERMDEDGRGKKDFGFVYRHFTDGKN